MTRATRRKDLVSPERGHRPHSTGTGPYAGTSRRRPPPIYLFALVTAIAVLVPYQVRYTGGGTRAVVALADLPVIVLGGVAFLTIRMRPQQSVPRGGPTLAFVIAVAILWHGTFTFYAIGQKFLGFILLLGYATLFTEFTQRYRSIAHITLYAYVASVTAITALGLLSYQRQAAGASPILGLNSSYPRLNGPIEDANAFAGLIAAALLIITALSLHHRTTRERVFHVCVLAVCVPGLLLTYSRSGWIAFAVGFIYLAVSVRSRRFLAALAVAAIALLSVAVLSPQFLQPEAELAQRENTVSARIETIENGLNEYLASPITGIGIGRTTELFGSLPHNTALWLLIEAGPMALVAGLWLAIGMVRSGVKGSQRAIGEIASTAAVVSVLGLSIGIEAMYQRQLWVFAGLARGLRILELEKRRETP